MRLRYTSRAIRQLNGIEAHVRQSSPAAARSIGRRIRQAASLLTTFSSIGHEGVLEGTREIGVPRLPYIIVHRIDPDDVITVIGVYHGAQLRPGQDPPSDDS